MLRLRELAPSRRQKYWQKLKAWLAADYEPAPVVCVPPGARLRLTRIPEELQHQFDLTSLENATFTQLSLEATGYRDALRVDNSAIVPLKLLPERHQVKVLRLASAEEDERTLDWNQIERVA